MPAWKLQEWLAYGCRKPSRVAPEETVGSSGPLCRFPFSGRGAGVPKGNHARRLPLWRGALLLAASAQSLAQTTFYADAAAFDAASATVVVEDFERFADAGTEIASGFQRNGNAYAPDGSGTDVLVTRTPDFTNFAASADGASAVLSASGAEDFTITFGRPQRAIGFDTYLNGAAATIRVFGEDNRLLGHRVHSHPVDRAGFFGVVASERIVAVQWTAGGDANIDTGIDNIRAAGMARVSVAGTGRQADGPSRDPSLSADGRYVAFRSFATNLVAGDTNGRVDVFVHDRATGQSTRVSVASDGAQGVGGDSFEPSLSADGRYVAFYSGATNLVARDTNGRDDVFVHDRTTGRTTRVSVTSEGTQGDASSFAPSLSANGRYVVFRSFATNLVAGDVNGRDDAFVHDRTTGETTRIGAAGAGRPGDAGSFAPSMSADGRYVAFRSFGTELVAGDTNGRDDAFVYDRVSGEISRVSVSSAGTQGDGFSFVPSMSADAHHVAFWSRARNLVSGDTNDRVDVFVHDRTTGETARVSVSSAGTQGDAGSFAPSLSADGRYVVFRSFATNLVADDTNGQDDVFVHDRISGETVRVSVSSAGAQGNGNGYVPSLSADARYVAFSTDATNLVAGDSNGSADVFVRVIDQDGDGILDEWDNCFALANSDQSNADFDRLGNACDADDDNDGMPDTFEITHGLDPAGAADAHQDADGDGDTNLAEYRNGTAPRNPRSNVEHLKRATAILEPVIRMLLDDG